MEEKKFFENDVQDVDENAALEPAEIAAILGEKMGDALLATLAVFGGEFNALVAQTYALSKAWAYMQVIGLRENVELKKLFEDLQPSFKKDAEEMLNANE